MEQGKRQSILSLVKALQLSYTNADEVQLQSISNEEQLDQILIAVSLRKEDHLGKILQSVLH